VSNVSRLRTALASRWFKLLLSLALLAVLFSRTDLSEMRSALAEAHVAWLAVALAVIVFSQFVSAYRWALLAAAVGFECPFGRICIYYFTGMYLNLFGPGTVAGDVARALFLAAGQRRALAFTTVLAHRVIGFVMLVWISAVAIVVLPDQPLPGMFRWLAALALPVTIAGWLWGPRWIARLLPPSNSWRVLVERDLAPYWYDRRLLAASLVWAAAAQLIQISGQFFIGDALGLHLPAAFFFVVVPLTSIVGTLPFSLQGIGVREAGFWYYLSRIGVQRETALAFGLLSSAVVLLSGLTGLPAFLMLRQEKRFTAEDTKAAEVSQRGASSSADPLR
jgi:uncharacterized membrane protein YbhN (UPF0104 family)